MRSPRNPVRFTPACRSFVMICSVLNRLRGILPPGRDARILTLGLERSQGVRSRRHRGDPRRAQHPRRAGSGHDRLRHRAAGHPAVGALEDDAHGPALRGAAIGAAQRRRAARRAAEALRKAAPSRHGRRHVGGSGVEVRPPIEGSAPDVRRDVIASKNPSTAGRDTHQPATSSPRPARRFQTTTPTFSEIYEGTRWRLRITAEACARIHPFGSE